MRRACGWAMALIVLCFATPDDGRARSIEEDAEAFGTRPAMWNPSISPDGQRIVFISMHASDLPVARVMDLATGKMTQPLASQPGELDVSACRFANDERIVCSMVGVSEQWRWRLRMSRPIAVDWDGEDMKAYMRGTQRDVNFGQFRSSVVDWLVEDDDRVLVNGDDEQRFDGAGEKFALGFGGVGGALSAVDIRTGRMKAVVKGRGDYGGWLTDGFGHPRARVRVDPNVLVAEYRGVDESGYRAIGEQAVDDPFTRFAVIGFAADRARPVAYRRDDDRLGVWQLEPDGSGPGEKLFEDDEADAAAWVVLGHHKRVAGALTATAFNRVHFFDERALEIIESARAGLPDHEVVVMSESLDGRFFVLFARTARDAGGFYRFDAESSLLTRLSVANPMLEGRRLARPRRIVIDSEGAPSQPVYVSLPGKRVEGGYPTVVLPFGGSGSRDTFGWDWLTQFLVARGYVVVQTPYDGRLGPTGLTEAATFDGWRRQVSEIDAALGYLVDKGVSDADRVCMAGWGYAGYVSLLRSIERPEAVRCVVGIASVTDPGSVVEQWKDFMNRRAIRAFVGEGEDVHEAGSPLKRAGEISVPVLLFHGKEDATVGYEHSERLAEAMSKAGKPVELVLYEDTEHSLDRNAARIDMLTRIGHFLETHLAKAPAAD